MNIFYLLMIASMASVVPIKLYGNSEAMKKFILLVLLSFMTIVLSFRAASVGTDTGVYINYVNIYGENSLQELFGDSTFEPGFDILIKISYLISGKANSIIIASGFITILFIAMTFFGESKYTWLSIYIFICSTFYQFCFNGIRQMLATAILYYSLIPFQKKKYIQTFLLLALAFSFHYMSILFLPIYFLYNKEIRTKTCVVMFLVLIVVIYIIDNVAGRLISQIPGYEFYNEDNILLAVRGSRIEIVFYVFSFFIFVFSKRRKSKTVSANLVIMFICILFAFLGSRNWLFSRVTWLYGFSITLLIPNSIYEIENAEKRFYILLMTIIIYGLYIVYLGGSSYRTIPYSLWR